MQLNNNVIDISLLPEVLKSEIINYYHNVLKIYQTSKTNNQTQKLASKRRFSRFFAESIQIDHLNTFSREVLHER